MHTYLPTSTGNLGSHGMAYACRSIQAVTTVIILYKQEATLEAGTEVLFTDVTRLTIISKA